MTRKPIKKLAVLVSSVALLGIYVAMRPADGLMAGSKSNTAAPPGKSPPRPAEPVPPNPPPPNFQHPKPLPISTPPTTKPKPFNPPDFDKFSDQMMIKLGDILPVPTTQSNPTTVPFIQP